MAVCNQRFGCFPAWIRPICLPTPMVSSAPTARANGFFKDGARRWITGWRAVNFMPYGIFTPMTGSVSGIYIRLPEIFMQREDGSFDLAIYAQNLDLLERAIQDRLLPEDGKTYQGAASVAVERGLYPLGTEFAHPLHYVDVRPPMAAIRRSAPIRGARPPGQGNPLHVQVETVLAQPVPARRKGRRHAAFTATTAQGWVDNGVGWYAGGLHRGRQWRTTPAKPRRAGAVHRLPQRDYAAPNSRQFTSGTGNTVDSTWALPRKFAGDLGGREMDYLGYLARADAQPDATPGQARLGDPLNRGLQKGELRHFLDNVVGVSLYGDMPAAIERFLADVIRPERGYAAVWPALDTASAEGFQHSQAVRQQLLRELTARGDYLTAEGAIRGELLYPPKDDVLAAARRYRQVVVTQRYAKGKDVFAETPVAYRYFRNGAEGFRHQDGAPYQLGEVITDRPVDAENPASITYRIGNAATLVDPDRPFAAGGTYFPDYAPLLAEPLRFEAAGR